jgi:hypothetical protein
VFPVLLALSGSLLPTPSLSDLLEGGSVSSWTVAEMLGWDSRLTREGLPLLVLGQEPLAGWGSFSSAVLLSPIEAGVWGGGAWQLDLVPGEIPDSSYASGIGLIENTSSRSRYSAYLRRPLPAGLDLDLSIDREDTLSNQRMVLALGDASLGARSWQTGWRGTVLWAAWSPGDLTGRASFGRLWSGDRRWEVLGSLHTAAGSLDVEAGAAGSLSEDTMLTGEGHLRLEMPVAGITAIARADVEDIDGTVEVGGTAGIAATVGHVRATAGAVASPGESVSLLANLSYRLLTASLRSGNGISGGLEALVSGPPLACRAGAAAGGDSLLFRGEALPSLRWGAAGRIYAGGSWELVHHRGTGSTLGTMDLKTMFTLDRFAFILSVEDVLDGWRSYTFGISWVFSDDPPGPPEEEEE